MNVYKVCEMSAFSMACMADQPTNKKKRYQKLENTLKYLSFCVVSIFFASLCPTDIKYFEWKNGYAKQAILYSTHTHTAYNVM